MGPLFERGPISYVRPNLYQALSPRVGTARITPASHALSRLSLNQHLAFNPWPKKELLSSE